MVHQAAGNSAGSRSGLGKRSVEESRGSRPECSRPGDIVSDGHLLMRYQ